MEIQKLNNDIPFDIIAQDKSRKIILVVEVKARHLEGKQHKDWFIEKVKSYLQAANTEIPFAMLVDLEDIQIFRCDDTNLSESVSYIKTAPVLSHYEPRYGEIRIFHHYLEGLVEAWLSDLAYHWKSQTPPASQQLAEVGLLQQIEDGTTYSGIALSGETVY
ncbi:MAG: hypothetical protein KME25_19375 [Symplocastrum torsivum CPER-KK1]|jgi:hypothetical protein|uniref:Type I restriction enzyme R protein N-terminal domain-containing protein n=1 Tax=Symplocastrum torsivum CPER-KK1 TaxID=450513 RepID=A0A951UAK1_9CYAN|nr:hypothetical protein [Symplocastrum torsivum CPER-KK1]